MFIVLAASAIAAAQPRPADVECKSTETQAECHTRLKCRPNEEVEACQKRLLRCKADESFEECKKHPGDAGGGTAGQRQNEGERGGDRGNDERNREQREREREREDRGGRERGDDRRDRGRGDDRDDDRGRGRRGGGRSGSRGRRGGGGGHGFEANKTFGLGLELGEPTGLNGKYFFSDKTALDFGVGWVYRHYYYGDGLHLYGDILFHPISLASTSSFELPLYIGGGLRYWDFHYCYQGFCDYGGSAIGIRIPVGISFDFNNAPLDIFLQFVPVLDFLSGDYYNRYRDREHFGVDLSVGIRFWFK